MTRSATFESRRAREGTAAPSTAHPVVLLVALLAVAAGGAWPGVARAASAVTARGTYHTCALSSAGGVSCWGYNGYGQLGDGTTNNRTTPVPVVGLSSGVAAIAAGAYHTCAITTAGGVKCWGRNFSGQVGDGTTTDRLAPVDVSGLTSNLETVIAIAGGNEYSCAVTHVGVVKCWGFNGNGQLGDGTTTQRLTPVNVSLAGGATSVAAGSATTCIRTSTGGAKCWGYNGTYNVGDGVPSATDRLVPVDVQGLTSGVSAVAAGLYHACALTGAGAVKCWGYNSSGEIGNGAATGTYWYPADVVGSSSGVATISASGSTTCASTSSGIVQCWGANGLGQLGDGTTTNRSTPVTVSGLTSSMTAVSVGEYHGCALSNAGVIKCWGYNGSGELGDGTTTTRVTPINAIECGNGVLETNEQCDDANLANGDCCSFACKFESAATVCRSASGECDAAETCTGSSGTCPVDVKMPNGTACTADARSCTPDVCDGGSSLCQHSTASCPETLDVTFDGDGKAELAIGTSAAATAVAIQPDGGIVLGGRTTGGSIFDFLLARLLPTGGLDPSFDGDGIAVVDFGGTNDLGQAVLLQPDGKILIGGRSQLAGDDDLGLARVTATGALDGTFGSGGKVRTSFGTGFDAIFALVQQGDGRIVAVGCATLGGGEAVALVRYGVDGTLDPTFGTGGKATTAIGADAVALAAALQPDGKIVSGGYAIMSGVVRFALTRHLPNGSVDPAFGTGGIVTTTIGGVSDEINAIALQADGKIVAAGFATLSGVASFAVARYQTNGSLDPTFGTGGVATFAVGDAAPARAFGVKIQSDGKLLVAGFGSNPGAAANDFGAIRLNPDGTLDTNFATGGKITTTMVGNDSDQGQALAIQANGRIVVAGLGFYGSSRRVEVLRYLGDTASTCGNGALEPQEVCDDGNTTGGDCCSAVCTIEQAATVCRGSAGECDVAESCTGFAGSCPADQFAAAGLGCTDDGAICTADVCSGASAACVHPAGHAGVACRPAADVCDVAETCTGVSVTCPADAFTTSGTECRASAGACDLAEACTGSSAGCPADAKKASGDACAGDGNPCTLDQCDGSANTCQHPAGNAGSTCRVAAGLCDVAETCDGTSTTCPTDLFQASSHTCRAATGVCDTAESCSGVDPDCPPDGFVASGMACTDDGQPCTNDACDGSGTCAHEALPDSDGDSVCDAQDECTNVGGGRDFAGKSKLLLAKVNTDATPGNDKLVLGGSFGLPAAIGFGDLDPRSRGARLVLKSGLGATLLDVALPAGAYDTASRRGWKTNAKQSLWQYVDKSAAPPSGIIAIKLVDRSHGALGGVVQATVTGKNGTYPVDDADAPLEAIVVLGNQSDAIDGKCGENAYQPPECRFNGPGNTLKCQR